MICNAYADEDSTINFLKKKYQNRAQAKFLPQVI